MTFTGFIGKVCMFPLRAIIKASIATGTHPNVLTLIGVLINVVAACALGVNRFLLAGLIMIVANIFDFIDGKVAQETIDAERARGDHVDQDADERQRVGMDAQRHARGDDRAQRPHAHLPDESGKRHALL